MKTLFIIFLCSVSAAWNGRAAPFDPTAFPSSGANPFTSNDTYTVLTGTNNVSLELRDPGNNLVATGVVASGVAVFTFNDIVIGPGVTVFGAREAGSRPVALLSQGNFTVAGIINVSGADGDSVPPCPNAIGANGGAAGPGGGGGGGGGAVVLGGHGGKGGVGLVNGQDAGIIVGANGGSVEPNGGGTSDFPLYYGGGGAFGGQGGGGNYGGTPYGDLTLALQGGSGGAGGTGEENVNDGCENAGGGGGGGGGGVEIGAVSNVVIRGSVLADGGAGGSGRNVAGGGAGGGILVHAPTVSLSGTLSANGGVSTTNSLCVPGSGGRIHIAATTINATDLNAHVSVAGGAAALFWAGSSNGVFTTVGTITPLLITGSEQIGDDLRLTLAGTIPGIDYEVQTRTDMTLGSWQPLSGSIPGDGGFLQTTVTNAFAVPQQYFRVQELP